MKLLHAGIGGSTMFTSPSCVAACSLRNQRINRLTTVRIPIARQDRKREGWHNAELITAAEGVAVDAAGNVYGAVVVTPGVNKYARK